MSKIRQAIWKFTLRIDDSQAVMMPNGAQILSVQMQAGVLCIWARVNPEAIQGPRMIRIIGTGHPIDAPEALVFIGTVQQGPLVWHIFEAP